ncbi:hypothetical protein ACFL1E_04925 [Candidatus Omnitrophota bacterium]
MTKKRTPILSSSADKKTNRRIVRLIKYGSWFSAAMIFISSLIGFLISEKGYGIPITLVMLGFCFLAVPYFLPRVLNLEE